MGLAGVHGRTVYVGHELTEHTRRFLLQGTMDAVIDRGTLRIGIAEEDFLPWIGRDKAGKLLGFEVDVA